MPAVLRRRRKSRRLRAEGRGHACKRNIEPAGGRERTTTRAALRCGTSGSKQFSERREPLGRAPARAPGIPRRRPADATGARDNRAARAARREAPSARRGGGLRAGRRLCRVTSGVSPCCASAATTKSRFSFRVCIERQHLQRAAAASAEVAARRTRRGPDSARGSRRGGRARRRARPHLFAGQRERHVERAGGALHDAVAAMAERVDRDDLSHGARSGFARAEQELAVARAAGDGRGEEARSRASLASISSQVGDVVRRTPRPTSGRAPRRLCRAPSARPRTAASPGTLPRRRAPPATRPPAVRASAR